MRAVTIVDQGVVVRDHPDPTPGAGQVLVKVRTAGLNAADLLQRQGRYPAPPGAPPDIPGLELAGEVIAAGPGSDRFQLGDRVMAVVASGGQAELAVVHERAAMPIPEGLSWEEAGGFPETFTTAHDALFTQAGLSMGERVLVHGAAGGVGVAAVQLAAAVNAVVCATVRDPNLREAVGRLGADEVMPADGFADTGPYDVVLELVGAPNMAANLQALGNGGRIVVIGVGAGARAQVDLLTLMGKRASLSGSTLRARPLEQKALAARLVEAHVLPLLATHRVEVPIAATYSLQEVEDAYRRFEAGRKLGKIVLVIT